MIKKSKILLWALAAVLAVGLVVLIILISRKKERLCPLSYAGRHCEPFCPCAKGWSGARCATQDKDWACSLVGTCVKGPKGTLTWADCQKTCKKCQDCGTHGTCDTKTGKCKCTPGSGWSGDDCNTPTCPNRCGSDKGYGCCDDSPTPCGSYVTPVTNSGKCVCNPVVGFTGDDCGTCDSATTCHGQGSCVTEKPYPCSCFGNWKGDRCDTCPPGSGSGCSVPPVVIAPHFPYRTDYVEPIPFLLGGWISDNAATVGKYSSRLDYLLTSNFNYITIEWSAAYNYNAEFVIFYKKWRAKGKIALMNITGQCDSIFDGALFTRCVNYKVVKDDKGNNECIYANKDSSPGPYSMDWNGVDPKKGPGWECTKNYPCPAVPGYTQYDSMAYLKAIIAQRKAQVGDIDGIMLDWEGTGHGWQYKNPDRMIPRLECFLENLIAAGVDVGKKKLIVVDFNMDGCWSKWSDKDTGVAPLLQRLTKISAHYAPHFTVLFEVESYSYINACRGDPQRTVNKIVDDVVPQMDEQTKKFSYFLYPASSGVGDKNPMKDVVDNFDELYKPGVISMSFYHLNYYSQSDLKLLSSHVEQYMVKP